MNTGSRDEQTMLANLERIAVASERQAAALERIARALEEWQYGAAADEIRGAVEGLVEDQLRGRNAQDDIARPMPADER